MQNDTRSQWERYKNQELQNSAGLLNRLGISLEHEQPHVSGERYLMSGRKLVLVGTYRGTRAIIKVSSAESGKQEIRAEHHARELLQQLRFAYEAFSFPQELLWHDTRDIVLFVTAYIEKEKNFVDQPNEEQFALLLRGLKLQEAVHATTAAHARTIQHTFPLWGAREYLRTAATYGEPEALQALTEGREALERYCGFLTHTDYVPHNLRVHNGEIYLLDSTSLRFGNKHESWARLVNFMLLHNPPLADALVQYVRDNRAPEEYESLRLMRIYKAAQLVYFYKHSLEKTEGNLRTLTEARIEFWRHVMRACIADTTLPTGVVDTYRAVRDSLRSEEERERQKNLH